MTSLGGDLTLLARNFCEIYAAVMRTDRADIPLAASGNYLYQDDCGLGNWYRLWSTPQAVHQAVEYTALLFQRMEKEWLAPNLKAYRKLFAQQVVGTNVNEAAPARDALVKWEQTTYCFLKIMKAPQGKTRQFLKNHFQESNPFISAQWKEVRRIQRIIKLEALSHGLLPINDFTKMASQKENPSQECDEWMRRFKELGKTDDQRGVHKGLLACVEEIATVVPQMEFNAIRLENGLWDNGLQQILCQPDPQHIAWRDTLKPGDMVGPYRLGQKLGSKEHSFDRKIVFEIEGRTDALLIIGQNRAILKMRYEWILNESRCIGARFLEVDPKGRYALVERLDDPIEGHQWSVDQQLAEDDKALLKPRINMIRVFLKAQKTPTIPLHYFRFDKNGNQRSLKSFQEEPFNFVAVENLIIQTSQGNSLIYRYLVEETEMVNHAYFKFFRLVVEKAAKGIEEDMKFFAGYKGIEDKDIVERAKKLYADVIAVREMCHSILVQQRKKTDKVSDTIIARYNELCCAGTLPSDFLQKIMA